MTTVRLFLAGERVGSQLARSSTKNKTRILTASRGAASDVASYVVPRARADIRQAGKFGPRWTDGFQGKVSEGGGFIKVSFTESAPHWEVFQFGATIHGKPMLWIPLSFAKDAQGISARDYPGKLFRVDRKNGGAPLLMTSKGGKAEAKYFGKESVTIPKKFHLVEIIREGAKRMAEFYGKRMKSSGK